MSFINILKANKKVIFIFLLVFILIIIVTPIMFNLLFLSWRSSVTFGDLSDWISWWGMTFSSIIGGIISGGLTLTGVIITIKHQEHEKFLENYSENRAKLDEILREAIEVKRVLNYEKNNGEINNLIEFLRMKTKYFSTLLKMSAEINYNLYNEVRFQYVMNLEVLYKQLISIRNKYDILTNELCNKLQIEDMVKQLDDLVHLVISEQEKLNSKYKKIK